MAGRNGKPCVLQGHPRGAAGSGQHTHFVGTDIKVFEGSQGLLEQVAMLSTQMPSMKQAVSSSQRKHSTA